MINRAFTALGKNISLVIVPVIMDLASLFLGLVTAGFVGESSVEFKFTLNVGVPSIANVLEQKSMAGGLDFNLAGGSGSEGIALLLFLVFFIAGAFVEAGFIGQVYELAKTKSPSVQSFLDYANRFWLRFLGLRLLILAVSFFGAFFSILFGFIGFLTFLILFTVLRIQYIYWEFTLLSEDLALMEALRLSRQHYNNRTPELAGVLVAILVVNFLASLVFNMLWTPMVIFIGIFIYNYLATALQLALMLSKPGLTDSSIQPRELL